MTPLEIVYDDTWLLAVNKRAGLLVYRSRIDADENDCLLDRLRGQTHGGPP